MPWDKTPSDRARDASRYGAAWRRAREAQLRRDRWRCQLRLPGCQGAASEVDHVLGAANDPNHTALRSVCRNCHRKHTGQQANQASRGNVTDPPCEPRTDWS